MKTRPVFTGVLAAMVAGCSALGVGSMGAETAATTTRSMRLEPGFFFGHDVRASRSVTYVLDLSGSMSGRTGTVVEQTGKDVAADVGGGLITSVAGHGVGSAAERTVLSMDKKVELVKDHLNASLRGLPDGAQFNIVLFSGGVQKLAPSLITASATSTTLVGAFVSQLESGGATSMQSAIAAGFETGADDIMVLTDGLPTDSTPEQILAMVSQENATHTHRVFTVGVGSDQARDFLSRLATDNGGKYLEYQ